MRSFLLNIALAFVWAALTGNFKAENFVLGFLLSFIIIATTSRIWGYSSYGRKAWFSIKFIVFIIWEIIVSNFRVAVDVLKPNLTIKPGVIAMPLDAKTDLEITIIANLISLTPGTLSLDVSTDKKTLFVHTMFAGNIDEHRNDLKTMIEAKVLELLR